MVCSIFLHAKSSGVFLIPPPFTRVVKRMTGKFSATNQEIVGMTVNDTGTRSSPSNKVEGSRKHAGTN